MSYIDDFITKLNAETARQTAKAEQHRVLESTMEGLIQIWNDAAVYHNWVNEESPKKADATVAFSYTSIECCCVNFHLASNEGLKGMRIESVLTFMLTSNDFTFLRQHEYSEMHWIAWTFKHTNGSVLMLRFWTDKSKLCRYVPTGKMIEELKLVCEETA